MRPFGDDPCRNNFWKYVALQGIRDTSHTERSVGGHDKPCAHRPFVLDGVHNLPVHPRVVVDDAVNTLAGDAVPDCVHHAALRAPFSVK